MFFVFQQITGINVPLYYGPHLLGPLLQSSNKSLVWTTIAGVEVTGLMTIVRRGSMRNALLTALLVLWPGPTCAQPQATVLKEPADWRFERLPMPPQFAPGIKLNGFDYNAEPVPTTLLLSRNRPVIDYFKQFPGCDPGPRTPVRSAGIAVAPPYCPYPWAEHETTCPRRPWTSSYRDSAP